MTIDLYQSKHRPRAQADAAPFFLFDNLPGYVKIGIGDCELLGTVKLYASHCRPGFEVTRALPDLARCGYHLTTADLESLPVWR